MSNQTSKHSYLKQLHYSITVIHTSCPLPLNFTLGKSVTIACNPFGDVNLTINPITAGLTWECHFYCPALLSVTAVKLFDQKIFYSIALILQCWVITKILLDLNQFDSKHKEYSNLTVDHGEFFCLTVDIHFDRSKYRSYESDTSLPYPSPSFIKG